MVMTTKLQALEQAHDSNLSAAMKSKDANYAALEAAFKSKEAEYAALEVIASTWMSSKLMRVRM